MQCAVSPCTFVFYGFHVQGSPAAEQIGVWRLNLLANNQLLYSDYFSITPVITQDESWSFNVIQSAPPRIHGQLKVIIHPTNGTWTAYIIYMPYAANLTAYDAISNQTLHVKEYNGTSRVEVNLAGARSDGYTFVMNFDLIYGVQSPSGWDTGNFVFTWREDYGQRFLGIHTTPETYRITLPTGAVLVDTIGINVINLNPNVTQGESPSISFNSTVPPAQLFGWSIIYRDFSYRDSHLSSYVVTTTNGGLNLAAEQRLPFVPITLGGVSLWSAIMSVFLLTGSELLSPIYARTGILINRRRLRIAALILVVIFITATAYQVIVSQSSLLPR